MNLVGQLPVKRVRNHKVCKPVIQHVDFNPALGRGIERVDEALAYVIVLPDIHFHQHRRLGRIDRVDHIVIELIA